MSRWVYVIDREAFEQLSPDERGLVSALHTTRGAAGRWKKYQAQLLDDEKLLRAIAKELGIYGGHTGNETRKIPPITYVGGANPRVWVGKADRYQDKATWEKTKLLDAVRRIFDIDRPGANQGRLFR